MSVNSNNIKNDIHKELIIKELEKKTQPARDDLIEFIKMYFK